MQTFQRAIMSLKLSGKFSSIAVKISCTDFFRGCEDFKIISEEVQYC